MSRQDTKLLFEGWRRYLAEAEGAGGETVKIFDFDNTLVSMSEAFKEIGGAVNQFLPYLNEAAYKRAAAKLLRDAQKLTYEHVIKADDIVEQPYLNPQQKVYGMFYQVDGNAATNSQFYATDSTKHFVTGSIYFYAKPNFDSIMPAASYIKNDMQRLLETLKWK